MKVNIRYDLGCKLVHGNSGKYGHSFGGDFRYRGRVPERSPMPVHLLFRLDLSDPALPFTIDGEFRFLPLFYAFSYDASPMSYLVRSDNEIEILGLDRNEYSTDFPYPGYPQHFDAVPINVEPITYEEQRDLAMGLFIYHHPGLDPDPSSIPGVSLDEWRRLRTLLYSHARLGRVHDLLQLPRGEPCPNPACNNRWVESCLDTIATIPEKPFPDLDLWQADGPTIQIVYEICNLCGCIRTYNTCD